MDKYLAILNVGAVVHQQLENGDYSPVTVYSDRVTLSLEGTDVIESLKKIIQEIKDKWIQESVNTQKKLETSTLKTNELPLSAPDVSAPLAELIVTHQSQVLSFISVECPHCKDKSYVQEIRGGFYLGSTEYCRHSTPDYSYDDSDPKILKQTIKVPTTKGKTKWNS